MPKRILASLHAPRRQRRRVASGSGGGGGGGSRTTEAMAAAFRAAWRANQRQALRMATYTRTTTKKKQNVKKMSDGVTTISNFVKGYKLKSYYLPLLKTAAPSYQFIRNAFRTNSSINQWGNQQIYTCDSAFLTQVYANVVPNASSSNQRAFLEKVNLEVEMANAGDQILNLELYEMACVKDTSISILDCLSQGFTSLQTGGQTLTAATIGLTPFNAPHVSQFWKVEKVIKVSIPAGHIHKHNSTFSPRMIINETRRANASFYAGLTRCILMRQRGQPVTQNDNNLIVGIGPSALDTVFIGRVKLKWVAANTQIAYQFGPTDLGNVITAEAMDHVQNVVDTFTAT